MIVSYLQFARKNRCVRCNVKPFTLPWRQSWDESSPGEKFWRLDSIFFLFAMRMNEFMFTGWCWYWYLFSFFCTARRQKAPSIMWNTKHGWTWCCCLINDQKHYIRSYVEYSIQFSILKCKLILSLFIISLQNKHYTFFCLVLFVICFIFVYIVFLAFKGNGWEEKIVSRFSCPKFVTIKLLAKITFLLHDSECDWTWLKVFKKKTSTACV